MHRVALEQNSGLGGGAEVVDVPDCVRQAVLSLTERVPARMGGAQEVNEIIPFLPFLAKNDYTSTFSEILSAALSSVSR